MNKDVNKTFFSQNKLSFSYAFIMISIHFKSVTTGMTFMNIECRIGGLYLDLNF